MDTSYRQTNLPTSVPDLKPNSRVCVCIMNSLGKEAGANSTSGMVRLKDTLAITADEARLADALCAEDDNLGFEGGHNDECVLESMLRKRAIQVSFGHGRAWLRIRNWVVYWARKQIVFIS